MNKQRIALGLFVLLLAAFFRLWMLEQVPPGLQHDEVFNAEDAVKLAAGDFRLYYPLNYGREGAFIWVLAAAHKAFGPNLMMIKFPALVFGLLTVALIFRFGCQNYSLQVGAVAGGLTAVSFWAVFYSRVGLRAVMLPMLVLLVLIFLARLFEARSNETRLRATLLTGFALGFTIYTYSSSFAIILVYALFVAFVVVFQGMRLRRHLRWLLLAGGIAALTALPMALARLTHPQGLERASDTILPLYFAADGHFKPLLDNLIKLAGSPAFVGDPTWRYNVAGRPLFLLPIGLLAYLGFGSVIARARRSPLNCFLVILTMLGLIPSLLTLQAPSFIRLIVIMPCVMLFISLAVARIGAFVPSPKAGWALAIAVVALTGIADYRALFDEWGASQKRTLPYHNYDEQGGLVQEIYRDDMQQLADYLQDSQETVVAVTTPDKDLDPLLYLYAGGAAKVDTHVVFFHGQFNIALSRQPMRLFVSPLSPIWEKHAHWLSAEFGARQLDSLYRQDGKLAFDVYQLNSQPEPLLLALEAAREERVFVERNGELIELQFPVQFGDLLLLQGIELPERRVFGENYGVHNQLYVEPLRVADPSTQFFMHLIDQDGVHVAQRDFLGASSLYWHPDVLIMQDTFVPFWEPVPAGVYHLYFGVYDRRTGQRTPIVDEDMQALANRLYLGEIQVIDRPA